MKYRTRKTAKIQEAYALALAATILGACSGADLQGEDSVEPAANEDKASEFFRPAAQVEETGQGETDNQRTGSRFNSFAFRTALELPECDDDMTGALA